MREQLDDVVRVARVRPVGVHEPDLHASSVAVGERRGKMLIGYAAPAVGDWAPS